MTLQVIQRGTGTRRDLVIGYHCAPLAGLSPTACCVADLDGHYTRIGAGGVTSIGGTKAFVYLKVGPFEVASVTLVGFSAGCQAVRAQLIAGETPEAAILLDGTSGEPQPEEWQIAPYRELADRARLGECLAVFTYTQQTYTETLPADERIAWTGHVVNLATGVPLSPGPDVHTDGRLHVLSYPSKKIDAEAHTAQVTEALPRILREIVQPYLYDRRPTDPAPPPPAAIECQPPPEPLWRDARLSLGERCVLISLEEYRAGVCEVPPGSNGGPRIAEYFAPAYRLETGKMLGITAGSWCAAAACWAARQCSLPGEAVPHPYVAAGVEIQKASQENGTWRPASLGYTPSRGDLAIFMRGKPESWERHVARVCDVSDAAGAYRTIDGNHGTAWGIVPRNLRDDDLLGFCVYPTV